MEPNDRTLHVERHLHFIMSLSEFFGCVEEKKFFEENDLKGIYFSPVTHLFYIFIDEYYIQTTGDLVDGNFHLVSSKMKNEKRVKFASDDVEIERLSIKYVKQTKCEAYLTINVDETYSLGFENGERLYGQIVATQVDKIAHQCPNQILSFGKDVFCFEKTVSSFFLPFESSERNPISNGFGHFPYLDLLLVFN